MRYNRHRMALSKGKQLGCYEILAPLGAGGMGEVYRATIDAWVERSPLRFCLPVSADDPDRVARFQREAQVLASLNHPHIAAIYGLEENAIVMELVEGRTLAERIRGGAIPLDEALSIARQIAEALEAAHEKGIIHRDLKPANVKITLTGIVKVLDFGLAKAGEPAAAQGNPESSPTRTLRQTKAGVILGTAAYMSPEQAEGKDVDVRSDIFSFGSVLYEMVTGRRAFSGESVISVLAAVLHENPTPVREVSPAAPAALARMIHRCLAKQPDKRWQSMADIRMLLEDLEHDDNAAGRVGQRRTTLALSLWPAIAIGLAALIAGVFAGRRFLPGAKSTATAPPVYTALTADSGLSFEPAISPDGKLLAWASDRAGEGSLDIWVRQLPIGRPVRVTDDPADDREPDFSPDGSRIVFSSDRGGGGLYIVSPFGGEARKIAARGHHPHFSPDGKWIAYWTGERHPGLAGITWIVSSDGGEPKRIGPADAFAEDPVWTPDSKGVIACATRSDWQGWLYLPLDGSKPGEIVSGSQLRNFGLLAPALQ